MLDKDEIELSLIVPCYNEEKNIKYFIESVEKCFLNKIQKYEIIFINDGSKDNTLLELENNINDNIRIINFSRNFGKESAMYAGLEKCIGKYVAIIDADLQQNPEYIIKMKEILDKNQNYDEVAAYQNIRKEGRFISFIKNKFYTVMSKETGLDMRNSASDFRMFRRNVVKAILLLSEKSRFSKGIFSYVGFNIFYIPYDVTERKFGETKWNLKKLLKYAINGITDFSINLLYLQFKIGIFTLILSIAMLVLSIINEWELYWKIISTVLIIISIESVLCGITNFYIGKIFTEIKNRPIYIEKEK